MSKYGECYKHPGNSMIDCNECFLENNSSTIERLFVSEPLTAESAVDAINDILFYGKGTNEENLQKAVSFMESFLKKIKKQK